MGYLSNGKFENKKIWLFFAGSFALHLVALAIQAPSFQGKTLERPETENKPITVRLIKESKSNQVVQTQNSERKLPKPERTYLGKKNNVFERETKAAQNGSFKAASKGELNGSERTSAAKTESLKNEKLKNLKFSDLAAESSLKKLAEKTLEMANAQVAKGLENGKDKKIGLSQSNDYLKEVPLGDFTRLNTQEYEFYGFYHRIRQKLEQFWGANLRERVEQIHRSGRSIASGQNLLTSLEIEMNSNGEITKIKLNSTSGIKELDDVAIDSFNQAGPFPNPPKKMLQEGVAKIKWGFAVETN